MSNKKYIIKIKSPVRHERYCGNDNIQYCRFSHDGYCSLFNKKVKTELNCIGTISDIRLPECLDSFNKEG
jgi:hypothetical protein